MKRSWSLVQGGWLVLAAALSVLASSAAHGALRGVPATKQPFVIASGPAPSRTKGNVVLVALPETDAVSLGANGRASARAADVQAIFARHGLGRYQMLGRAGARGRPRFVALESDRADFDARAAARDLAATGAFRAVAPNLVLHLDATVPNDPYIDPFYEWHVTSTAGVALPTAWDVGQGDPSTVIAVMDNGIDINHPDLASQVWVNPGEIPGNGIDDDLNGYVDDVKGWDFGVHDNDPSAEAMPDPSGIDLGFHGTFVAGVAAGATNNGVGIAGAGWKCRLMALKIGDAAGDLTLEAVTEAFGYVVDQGAAVLNMSFGTNDSTAAPFFQALVDDATAAGIVCVAAAGNDGLEIRSYPASCVNVLSVGATDDAGARASFSNWGSSVDLAAPGAMMWSAIPQNYELDFLNQIIYLLYFGWDGENPYMYGDGTSFASPLVAGVCGLLRAQNPSLTPQEVIAHIAQTGDLVPFDHPIGPRVNAYRALTQPVLAVEPDAGPAGVSLGTASPNPFAQTTTIGFTLSQAGPVRLSIYDVHGRMVRGLIAGTLPAGRHTAMWDARGSHGRAVGSGVYFAVMERSGVRGTRKIVLAR